MAKPDVIVVGAGVIGSSIAYHLARAGVPVAVYDRTDPAEPPSASWASAGGLRRQRREPREWPIALEASKRWPALERELEADIGFRAGGHLHIVEREDDVDALRDRIAREQAAGLDVHLVAGAGLRAIAPSLTQRALAASYSPGDGQADPARTTKAFASAARRCGTTYRTNARVTSLCRTGGRITGVTVNSETVPADWVVLAAGAWSAPLAASAGIELPITPAGLQMLLTDSAPPALSPTVTAEGRKLSLKQLPSGEFMIGGGWPAALDAEALSCRVLGDSVTGSRAVACDVAPGIRERRIARRWCGIEALSFDSVPLVGPAYGVQGLFLAVGFSGHGFQLSPAIGRAAAAALSGAGAGELEPLSPSRAEAFPPEDVAAWRTAATMEPG